MKPTNEKWEIQKGLVPGRAPKGPAQFQYFTIYFVMEEFQAIAFILKVDFEFTS